MVPTRPSDVPNHKGRRGDLRGICGGCPGDLRCFRGICSTGVCKSHYVWGDQIVPTTPLYNIKRAEGGASVRSGRALRGRVGGGGF